MADDFIFFNGVVWNFSNKDEKGRKVYVREGFYKDKLVEDQNGKIELPSGKKYTLVRRGKNKNEQPKKK